MCALNGKRWILPSEKGREKEVMHQISQTVALFQEDESLLGDILTCVAEAYLNALEHGNELDNEQEVMISFLVEEDKYILRVYDQGAGFVYKPHQVKLQEKMEEENPRGWGLFLIQELADEVLTGVDEDKFFIQISFQRQVERGK